MDHQPTPSGEAKPNTLPELRCVRCNAVVRPRIEATIPWASFPFPWRCESCGLEMPTTPESSLWRTRWGNVFLVAALAIVCASIIGAGVLAGLGIRWLGK